MTSIDTTSSATAESTDLPTITGISHVDLSVTDLDRSERFYTELLGATRLLERRSEEHRFAARDILHLPSMTVIGLVLHDGPASDAFVEQRVGLDHLAFNVESPVQLEAWASRLDALGIAHSGIVTGEFFDAIVVRDPDHIQLEFFHLRPAAASLMPD